MNSDLELELRNTTWTKKFSIIYVDNPVGTGFSFTDKDEGYSTRIIDIGQNLFIAMQQFFSLFSEYASNDFYVTGESMAGTSRLRAKTSILSVQIPNGSELIPILSSREVRPGDSVHDPSEQRRGQDEIDRDSDRRRSLRS